MRPIVSSRLLQIATIVTALAASACGGGGGGNVTPPGGGGGGGPTPTPSPVATNSPTASPTGGHTNTPAPTNSPTPGKTATPTPTSPPTHPPTATPMPTATPTNPPGRTFLPDTTGRFALLQILDAFGRGNLSLSTPQIQSMAPHYDFVWGSFQPSTWHSSNGGVLLSRYYMPVEDNTLVSGNTLSYFQTNHPDWILYGCDSNGNPTTHLAWSGTGFKDTPLNIHNPSVVQYQLDTIVSYLQSNGYNALAIDNVVFFDFLQSPNAEVEQGNPRPIAGDYGCGYYSQGVNNPNSFVKIYSSGFNKPDPTFIADMNNWVAQARARLAPLGMKVVVNHPPFGNGPNANEQTLLNNIDGLLDENGYTHFGTLLTGNAFNNTMSWVELLQARGIAALITDYFCSGNNCSNDPATLTPQQADWALASYAIGDNGGEAVYISPHGGALDTFRNEYSTRYGKPCGAFTGGGFVYMRRFTNGFAVVNASGSSTQVNLPAGHNYTDIEGRAVSNPLTVNATDAFMLLTGGNGCS